MRLARWLTGLILAGILTLAGCQNAAELPRGVQTVDGMVIYLGVVPAGIVQGHRPGGAGAPQDMHGGAPPHVGSHHVVVALFDAESGTRITDARVRAGIGNRSSGHGSAQWLEPMLINGTVTYGGFLRTAERGSWRIHLEIQRPGRAPTKAEFAYEHAAGT